ncbi:unknown protein [Seminavis robusta]|uniref:Uncharacterized protein n=1 Tax=Seminavis robusta TaxID=568900 RepID=A0A9N8EXB2_9STRA|nr:unknown protein [Seminavis robusta]|eukprot:Sro2239_g320250.1 n/a (514) ;mRNA; r:13087-14628
MKIPSGASLVFPFAISAVALLFGHHYAAASQDIYHVPAMSVTTSVKNWVLEVWLAISMKHTQWCGVALTVYLVYVLVHLYQDWLKYFAFRKPRSSPKCPSHDGIPDVINMKPQECTQLNTKHQRGSSDRPALWRTSFFSADFDGSILENLPVHEKKSKHLDVDHVYLNFGLFLVVNVIIYPPLVLQVIYKLTTLRARYELAKMGLVVPKAFIPESVSASLILNTKLVLYYCGKVDEGATAQFVFPNFAALHNDGTAYHGTMEVHIDLNTKTVAKAWWNGETLSPKDCFAFVSFSVAFNSHIKAHAVANWAVNVETKQLWKNPLEAINDATTVIWNHWANRFNEIYSLFQAFGMLSTQACPKSLSEDVFGCALKNGIPQHDSSIAELAKHSRYVDFLMKVRIPMLRGFMKYKASMFPGVEFEALFVGTVGHSIGHYFFETIVADSLWLDVDSKQYGLMAQFTKVAHGCFTPDLPFYLISPKYKDQWHPFYRTIYQRAAAFDKELADTMETCIAK